MRTFACLLLMSQVWGAEPERTNEPIPYGPFIPIKTHIENVRLVESHDLYRKWDYDRVFTEDRGVGATFTLFEFYLESPAMSEPKYWKNKIKVRLEPNETKSVPGFVWIDGGTRSSVNDLHFKNYVNYYGVDDNGNPVNAEFFLEQ